MDPAEIQHHWDEASQNLKNLKEFKEILLDQQIKE